MKLHWDANVQKKVNSKEYNSFQNVMKAVVSKALDLVARFQLELEFNNYKFDFSIIFNRESFEKCILAIYLNDHKANISSSFLAAKKNLSDEELIEKMTKLTDYSAANSIFETYLNNRNSLSKPLRAFFNFYLYLYLLKKANIMDKTPNFIRNDSAFIKDINRKLYLGEETIEEDYSNMLFVNDIITDFLRETSLQPNQSGFPSSSLNTQEQLIEKKLSIQALRETEKQKQKENFFDLFKGEFDKMNYTYAGWGILVKRNRYLYEGFFRNSKKTGFGFKFSEIVKEKHFEFYHGEWMANKKQGFGVEIVVKSTNEKILTVLRMGFFNDGKFKKGNQQQVSEFERRIEIENFEGSLVNEKSEGHGKLNRKIFEPNEFKGDFEKTSEFIYAGNFKAGRECGKGQSTKVFKNKERDYVYEGEFLDGKMEGFGEIMFNEKYHVMKYKGIFREDRWFCDYGIVYFRNGEVFEGFFNRHHAKENVGMFKHNDSVFFGYFQNDKKNFLGRTINENKLLFVGEYCDGEKCGKCDAIKYISQDEYSKSVINVKISFMLANDGDKGRLDSGIIDTSHFKMKKVKKSYLFDDNLLIEELK